MDTSLAIGSQSMPSSSSTAASNGRQDSNNATAAPNRVSLSDAMIAIKNLDRFAFSGSLAELHQVEGRPNKVQKVSDVISSISVDDASKPTRFSRLSGIGQLHREKARQNKRQSQSKRLEKKNGSKSNSVNDERSSTYRPFSLPMLLQRLSTFSISTYSNKPNSARLLSPLGMASHGWKHGEGQMRDEVMCSTCTAKWKVDITSSAGTKEQQTQEWNETEKKVVETHEGWCPWRIRSCSTSLYRVPIRSVLETRAEIELIASKLSTCAGLETVQILHEEVGEQSVERLGSKFPQLSTVALVLALFGWQLSGDGNNSADQSIVQCPMCARRAGLWTYVGNVAEGRSGKKFDVLREHKWYCPMVNGEVQSGRWIESGANGTDKVNQFATSSILPAWQLRLQLLLGTDQSTLMLATTNNQSIQEFDTRNMRSSEILAKVKSFLDGRSS